MTQKTVSDLFDVGNRFLRSVQLERDINDPNAFDGYVLTDFSRACFSRMVEGAKPLSTHRAWRMTGDYGSGKSSFALLLARSFGGFDTLPSHVQKGLDGRKHGLQRLRFVCSLTTCSRQPLARSVLDSLYRTVTETCARGMKAKLAQEIQSLLDSGDDLSDGHVVDLVVRVNEQIIADGKGQGLLLIIDELGKFLEYAAAHSHTQDVFLLQRLAEVAAGSGKKPLFVVCLLHQGFNAYAEQLNQAAQREWDKVAGRFEEIIFNQPVEQIGHLIGSALNVRTQLVPPPLARDLRLGMDECIRLGWFGTAPASALREITPRLFPIHPMVLPVLIRVFRRFGQNERSLFSFLMSSEPFGLKTFAERHLSEARLFRLHDLYDYVRANFGHKLAVLSYRSYWTVIESVIESYATEDDLHIRILKTVGILNLLNDSDLLANNETLACALTDADQAQHRRVKGALDELRKRKALYDRGHARGLCLWPHTSVDIDKALDDARRAVQPPHRVADIIKEYLQARPIVARRHYIKTGNLRYYDVHYCSNSEATAILENVENADADCEADGQIIIHLCETAADRAAGLEFAKRQELGARSHWVVAVSQPLANLASLVHIVQQWEWVATNTPELNADRYAREEVSRQLEGRRSQLEKRIQDALGLRLRSKQKSLEWFHGTRPLVIRDGRHLLEELSRLLDDTYPDAPRIHNELINRHVPSSAANAARMRLIERMFVEANRENLGMDPAKKPPEMSMYLSVLKNTGLHRKRDGIWTLAEPHDGRGDDRRVFPAMHHIREIVRKEPDRRVNVAELMAEMRRPPYGVRNGVFPLLLTVFAVAHRQDVAFYKDGTFLREMNSEAMLMLIKAPNRFDIQYCRVEGVRAELFDKLLSVLQVAPAKKENVELLDVVTPLCKFIAQLPPYVLNSRKLSSTASAVRDAILSAREPSLLLFSDLPKACGCDPIPAMSYDGKGQHAFVGALRSALDELRASYPELQERMKQKVKETFDLPGSFKRLRTALARRAESVILGVTEPKLKAFCFQLLDDNRPDGEWLESLGSCLALKPPSRWHDTEEAVFAQELAVLATRFHHVESIVFSAGGSNKDRTAVRLSITHATGDEQEQVVHFSADEEQKVSELQKQFDVLLRQDYRLALAAASRALAASLKRRTDGTDE